MSTEKEVFRAKEEIWEIDSDTGERRQVDEGEYPKIILSLGQENDNLESELAALNAKNEGLKNELRTLRRAKRKHRRVLIIKNVPSIEEQIRELTEA